MTSHLVGKRIWSIFSFSKFIYYCFLRGIRSFRYFPWCPLPLQCGCNCLPTKNWAFHNECHIAQKYDWGSRTAVSKRPINESTATIHVSQLLTILPRPLRSGCYDWPQRSISWIFMSESWAGMTCKRLVRLFVTVTGESTIAEWGVRCVA